MSHAGRQPSGRPKTKEGWDQRYVEGVTPWDTDRVDEHLIQVVSSHGIKPTKTLEVGCGTATNTLWLAERGFEVTALDLAPTAIERAKEKVQKAGFECTLLAKDFLKDDIPGAPFGFLYDRACLHTFDDDADRRLFAERARSFWTRAAFGIA